ncbi:MAG TPA: M28 family peptidase [Anaerolineae bacterium]|nr:M28 family peptidase [Anaerolineae bacterium]
MSNLTATYSPQAAAEAALRLAGRLIDAIGPRPSGSAASRQAADALHAEAAQFADRAWSEDFPVHPGAFLGWIRLLVLLYIAGVALLWLEVFWLAALLATLGIVILIGQFFFYRELLDPFFPRQTGRNVLAALEPAGEARGQLIVSGHHDSARIFNFLAQRPALYPWRVTGGIAIYVLFLLTCWLLVLWTFISGAAAGWSAVAASLFSLLLLWVGQLWWFASSQSTPGAGDNLASTAAAWEALRHMAGEKTAGRGLQHLRVIAASWDAEEAGLRGARAWVKAAPDDDRLALPTWNLNLECLYDAEEFFLLTSDVNGTVQLSPELAGQCQRLLAGRGRDVPAKPIAFLTGGTDAGELARGGAQATTLIGMPWGNTQRSSVYHTPRDVLSAVSPEAVAAAMGLAIDLASELDAELGA